MKHVWSVLCSKSITDKEENLISLISCIEHVEIKINKKNEENPNQQIKAISVNLELVSSWFDNDLEHVRKFEMQIKITDNRYKEIEKFSAPFVLAENMKILRTRMKIAALPIIKSGLYFFKVSFRNEKEQKFTAVAEIPLELDTIII